MKDSNLADKVLSQIEKEAASKAEILHPDQWGIDDTGFPWPNPVNAEAVAARVFFKWGVANGVYAIYRIDNDIYLGKKRLPQNKATLLSLYNVPKVVWWANDAPEMQDQNALWAQIKRVISSEWPVVWSIINEIAPEHNRDYIKVTDNIIWGKNEADIISSVKEDK